MKQSVIFFVILFANIICLTSVLLADGTALNGNVFLISASFLALSLFFSFIISSNIPRSVSFMLVLYWSYGLILPSIYQVNTGNFFWQPNSVNQTSISSAALLTLISVISFIFGYMMVGRRRLQKLKLDNEHCNYKQNNNEFFSNLSILCLSILGAVFSVTTLGIAPLLSTRAALSGYLEANALALSAVGFVRILPSSISIAVFMILAYQLFILKSKSRSLSIITFLSLLPMLLLNFPLSIPRYIMVSILFIIVFIVFNKTFAKYRRVIFSVAPALIFIIFPFLGKFNRGLDLYTDFQIPPLSETFVHGDYDGFQSTMNAINLVNVEGFSYGSRLFSALLFFIPRDIWLAKNNPTGSDAAAVSGYDFLNISMPIPAEFYVDFGYFGVIFGMIIIGRLVHLLDIYLVRSEAKGFLIEFSLIGITLAAYMPILFRGPLLGIIPSPASVIFVIFVWSLLRRITWRNNG